MSRIKALLEGKIQENIYPRDLNSDLISVVFEKEIKVGPAKIVILGAVKDYSKSAGSKVPRPFSWSVTSTTYQAGSSNGTGAIIAGGETATLAEATKEVSKYKV